jgi:hypothetical protein
LVPVGCGAVSTPGTLGASAAPATRAHNTVSNPCLTAQCMYVTNYHFPQYYLTAFPVNATGDVPPAQAIGGPDSGFTGPGIAVDAGRNIYVANRYAHSVTVYAPGAGGDAVPIKTITGRKTRLRRPTALALDASSDIVVVNQPAFEKDAASVTVYLAGSTGNVAPLRRIAGSNTGLAYPAYVAIGSDDDIYVANTAYEDYDSVTVYSNTADGNAAPIRTIAGSNTELALIRGVALDAADNLYVATGYSTYSTINEYPAGADGNVAPIRVIGGPVTLLNGALGVALDAAGNIYVSNLGEGTRRRDYKCFITVYAADAVGDAAPIQIIQGKAAMLSSSLGLAIR